jgi:hypothetical protein
LEHESDDGASYSALIDGDFLVKQITLASFDHGFDLERWSIE